MAEEFLSTCVRLGPQAQADIATIRSWLVAQTHGGAYISRAGCIYTALRIAAEKIEEENGTKPANCFTLRGAPMEGISE